jgi:hypothetical protein
LVNGVRTTVTAVPTFSTPFVFWAPVSVTTPAAVVVAVAILPAGTTVVPSPMLATSWSAWYFSVMAVRAELAPRISSETRARIV